MKWIWEDQHWPNYHYDSDKIAALERQFLLESGEWIGVISQLNDKDKEIIKIHLLTDEALKTSEIEAEYLDRDSLQSSIQQQFGIHTDLRKASAKEQGIAKLMVQVYQNFSQPLTQDTLFNWHELVMNGRTDLIEKGTYRSRKAAMQIVSGAIHNPTVHYQAPAGETIAQLMDDYVSWFNQSDTSLPITIKAALAHLRFEQIHPFEDGNGRIGRALAELCLSQAVGKPMLLSLSSAIADSKKQYYDALQLTNRSLDVTAWVEYFLELILEANQRSKKLLNHILYKSVLLEKISNEINKRQLKVILRIFDAGINGFLGGLSSKNYQTIAKTSSATATRDLKHLVELGALYRTGENRNARYWLNANE